MSSADLPGRAAARALGVEVHAQRVEVGGRVVRLWSAELHALAARAAGLTGHLDERERAQAGQIRVATAAARFIGGRAMLRVLLGATLAVEAPALRLVLGAHGKPALSPLHHPGAPGFNLAHSAGVVTVALCHEGEVGVDVERRREVRELARLVRRALTPAERALYERWVADGAAPLDAFLRAWTVKEARLKALGLSVGAGLSRDHAVAVALPWEPVRLPHGEDYFAAVAVASSRS